MLSEQYLAALPAALVLLYSQAEEDILSDMARKIAAADFYLSSVQWQHERLALLGMTSREILRRLSSLTQKTQRELRALIRDASAQTLLSDGLIARDEQGEIKLPKSVQSVVQAGLARTGGTFENLTRTTAKTATKQFEDALDRTHMQIITGAFSPETAIRQAVKDLSAQGVHAAEYPSGRADTLETAVRRATVTGVNQTAIAVALERAKELGAELMELTAHQEARPSHAAWQGKIVRVSGEPEAGENYLSLSDVGYGTGAGFGGWNCRHSWHPYWPGTARTWTDEQLEALKKPSVTYNGKPMTDYEASQQQRYFERQQRRWKREYKAMEAAGQDTYEAAAKIREWQEKEKDFLRQTGRKADADRATVAEFSWQDAKKAGKELAKYEKYRYNKDGTIIATDDWKSRGKVTIPREYRPFAVVETQTSFRNGTVQIDRTLYDENGRMVTQIHPGSHNRPDQHKRGTHGEHGHTYRWREDGKLFERSERDLTEQERREHADLLGESKT